MLCPRCAHGVMKREPARVICPRCSCELNVVDASAEAYALQRALDAALAPTSVECRPEYNPSPPDFGAFPPPCPARRIIAGAEARPQP